MGNFRGDPISTDPANAENRVMVAEGNIMVEVRPGILPRCVREGLQYGDGVEVCLPCITGKRYVNQPKHVGQRG